ncbi:hypothetical protein NPIL_129401, partial [Nephila pilipes]
MVSGQRLTTVLYYQLAEGASIQKAQNSHSNTAQHCLQPVFTDQQGIDQFTA